MRCGVLEGLAVLTAHIFVTAKTRALLTAMRLRVVVTSIIVPKCSLARSAWRGIEVLQHLVS